MYIYLYICNNRNNLLIKINNNIIILTEMEDHQQDHVIE